MKLMKMMAVGVVAAVMMSSCESDDNYGNRTTVVYTDCMNYVNDTSEGGVLVTSNSGTIATMGYSLNFDFDKNVVSVGIAGLKLAEGDEGMSLELYDIPLRTNGYGYKATATDIQPYSQGVPKAGYIVDEFTLEYYGGLVPVIALSYEINGRYEVAAMPVTSYYGAETAVTTIASGDVYDTTDPYYGVVLSHDSETGEVSADVHVYNAKFASNMPAQSEMVFKGVGVEFSGDDIVLSAARVVPEISNTPYERFMITNLSGRCYVASGIEIEYEVAGTWKVESVSSDLK